METSPVRAAGPEDSTESRWGLAGALEVGILGHTGKGNVDSTNITGPRVVNPPSSALDLPLQIVAPDASREPVVIGLVGGTFELMTPQLFEYGPRFFIDVNVSNPFGSEVGLARQGDPDVLGLPEPVPAGRIVGESAIEGRGNKITVVHEGPQIHAGIGVALSVDVFDGKRITLKPSLVYSRLKMDVYGVALRAARLNDLTGAAREMAGFDGVYRTIFLSEKLEEVYHGIGPALEIEYDTGERFGPFDVTLFLKGHGSRLMGDLKTNMAVRNPDPAAVDPGEIAFFKYSQDRWVFRASTGIRFRWSPKSRR